MKPFSNNRELYDYLLFLRSVLKERGAVALSKVVTFASGQASSMSTEFLGESRLALKQVLKEESGVLTQQERDDLLQVVKQLDDVFGAQRKA